MAQVQVRPQFRFDNQAKVELRDLLDESAEWVIPQMESRVHSYLSRRRTQEARKSLTAENTRAIHRITTTLRSLVRQIEGASVGTRAVLLGYDFAVLCTLT